MNKNEKRDRGSLWLLALAGLALAALVVLGLRKGGTDNPADAPTAAGDATSVAGAEAEIEVSPLQQLEGRWHRTDGDYALDVQWAGADSQVRVAYYNPGPIHVSRAEVSDDGDRPKLLVELQDTGYPGCVYTLYYDSEEDTLNGDYYQAAMRETFPVVFTRKK